MNRVLAAISLIPLLSLAPHAAYATLCSPCSGSTACSDPSEVCLGGLPENDGMNGRCVTPCPSPGAPFGGCPTNYTCIPLTSGDNVCAPRSDDCTNLSGYTPAAPGQSCATQSCTNNALCLSGVCRIPCTSLGGSGCPAGEFCGFIGLPDNPFFICGPSVGEGEICGAGDLCRVGICLDDGTTTTCYRNCGTGAASSACSGAQTCSSISLSGGESISICEPPMSNPNPMDAGFPDAQTAFPDAQTSFPDAQTSFPDASTNPGQDARPTNPGDDATVGPNPGEDGSVVDPGQDGGTAGPRDSSSTTRPGGGGSVVRRGGCECVSTPSQAPLALLLLPIALMLRRRFSGRRTPRS